LGKSFRKDIGIDGKILFLKILKMKRIGWSDANWVYVVQNGGGQGLAVLNRTMIFPVSLSEKSSVWGGHLEYMDGFR
jgi:hypothetical protein